VGRLGRQRGHTSKKDVDYVVSVAHVEDTPGSGAVETRAPDLG